MKFTVDVSVSESGRKRPEYHLNTDLNGEVSLLDFLNFTKATLIATADAVLGEEQAQGFDKKPIVVVDGRRGKPVENVNPLGSIEFTARADAGDLLIETYAALLERSPVLTGRYKSSNFVFVNGRQVATDMQALQAWLHGSPDFKNGDVIRFVNIQPYGRKLERLGVTSQRQQSRSITKTNKKSGQKTVIARQPNGTYFLTARAMRFKYKRNVDIKFSFISGAQLGLAGAGRVFVNPGRRGKKSAGRPYLYPSIIVTVNENGVL